MAASHTNPSLLTVEHIPSRPIFTKRLENITAYQGDKVEFKVDIWTENTLMPYVVWRSDLPFTWSTPEPGKQPDVVIDSDILELAIEGKVRSARSGPSVSFGNSRVQRH